MIVLRSAFAQSRMLPESSAPSFDRVFRGNPSSRGRARWYRGSPCWRSDATVRAMPILAQVDDEDRHALGFLLHASSGYVRARRIMRYEGGRARSTPSARSDVAVALRRAESLSPVVSGPGVGRSRPFRGGANSPCDARQVLIFTFCFGCRRSMRSSVPMVYICPWQVPRSRPRIDSS